MDTFYIPLSVCSNRVWLSSLVILRPSVLVRYRDLPLLQANALQAELIFSRTTDKLYASVACVASAWRGGERKDMGADKAISIPLLLSPPVSSLLLLSLFYVILCI